MPRAGKWLRPSSLCFFKQMVNQYQKDGRHGGIGLYQNKGGRNYGAGPSRLLIPEQRRSQSETQRDRIGGQMVTMPRLKDAQFRESPGLSFIEQPHQPVT